MDTKKEIIESLFADYNDNLKMVDIITKQLLLLENESNILSETQASYSADYKNDLENLANLREQKRRLQQKIYLRDILFIQLNEFEKTIISMRYMDKLPVYDIIKNLFISQSNYYRKYNKMYAKLVKFYDSFEELFL